ncbi:MAG: TRAP transporter substrate-binding protein [Desulfotomaculales bacterium]
MRKLSYLLGIFLVLALATVGCSGKGTTPSTGEQPGKQEVITLKLADSVPVTHTNSAVVAKFFIKRIEELTNGRVKIEYYPAEQLGKQKDLLNMCSQGITDIAMVAPSFLAGQLSLNTVMILPFYSTATEGTAIYMRLNASGLLADEFKKYNVRPIIVHTTPQYDIVTVKKQIKSPSDLKGMKIKTSGGIYNKIAEKYGIVPVEVPSPETYEATQRGIVEGVLFSYPAIKSYRLNELAKYVTFGASFGGYPCVYVMNEQKFQSLPEDIRKALTQVGEETSKVAGEAWDKEEEKLLKEFEQQGLVIYRLSPEEKGKWKEYIKGIDQIWIEDMEKKGLPGKKVYEEFEKACKEGVTS